MLRVDHHHLHMTFQNIEDGSPEDSRAFHRDLATLLVFEPFAQTHQIWSHRAKGLAFFATFSIGCWGDEAGHDGFLVDIQTRASFIDNLHPFPPFKEDSLGQTERRQATGYRAWVKFSHTCFAIADERQTLVLGGIQVILLVRLMALVSNRPSALGPPSLKYTCFFFLDSGARQRMNYCWRIGFPSSKRSGLCLTRSTRYQFANSIRLSVKPQLSNDYSLSSFWNQPNENTDIAKPGRS